MVAVLEFGDFSCSDNKLIDLEGGKNIVKRRFKESLDELGIQMPESIPGYTWI